MTETAGRLDRGDGQLAWRRTGGRGPTVVWLCGFHSDMSGNKVEALAAWGRQSGRDVLRFDYFGHGESDGDIEAGTVTRWREDALAVIDELTDGPVVLVGSSMGAWIACLATLARPQRVRALILLAAVAGLPELSSFPPEAADALERDGVWRGLGPERYPITRELLDDGARWSITGDRVPIQAPVRLLHGGADDVAPWTRSLFALANAIEAEDVVYTLIRDGDHRLSRPQDIRRLIGVVEEVVG